MAPLRDHSAAVDGTLSERKTTDPASLSLESSFFDWNWGLQASAGGVCLVVGDKLYFYTGGRAPTPRRCRRNRTRGAYLSDRTCYATSGRFRLDGRGALDYDRG